MTPLARVISDPSAHPCALNKLRAYLSTHHCLENLQFIQDASRYRAYYAQTVQGDRRRWSSSGPDYDNLRTMWKDLLNTYIVRNGHREVNLPSEARDYLLNLHHPDFIPHPSVLDDAIKASYQLIEDSILPSLIDSDRFMD
ncbi:RGS domain-containing protein [Stachybotrys elegans]|uniref:RGS domain-containing protein n=1 Tax=Stachybotrys elegans TaxID=80388 RepID=A0A8K0SBE8_9HYPO|nr:RGS domain-containing protein [Stachybotrys elegans]